MRTAFIAVGVGISLFVGACSYKYIHDQAAWQKEQDALIRLRSGMQYEAMLMVRSRLADADAGVEDYASQWRIFPVNHSKMLEAARKGILYTSNALDWSTKASSQSELDTDAEDATALASYPDVTSSLPRWCSDGQLAFNPSLAAADFRVYGDYWLELALGKWEQKPSGSSPPLEPRRELQACQQQQIATVKAQNAALAERLRSLRAKAAAEEAEEQAKAAEEKSKEEAFLAKYPYEVELSSYYPCSFDLSVDGEQPLQTTLRAGAPRSFRMQRYAVIKDGSCDVYSTDRPPYRTAQTEIEVKVNGSRYLPKWLQEGRRDAANYNVPYYQTTISPTGQQ